MVLVLFRCDSMVGEEAIRVDTRTASVPLVSISARTFAKRGLCTFLIVLIACKNDLLILVVTDGRCLFLSEQSQLFSACIASKHDVKRLFCLLDGGLS